MAHGYLRYRCRLCGELFNDVHTPDLMLTIMYLIGEMSKDSVPAYLTNGIPIHATSVHNCTNRDYEGCTGVADLIGGRRTSENGE